ncbi:hypothetical protein ScPMuIL_012873 [Solemya velum]
MPLKHTLSTLLLCIFLLDVAASVGNVEVLTDGIHPVGEDDVAIVLFITVQNRSPSSADVAVAVRSCCQVEQTGCQPITVLPGYLENLQSLQVANLTITYPTLHTCISYFGSTPSILSAHVMWTWSSRCPAICHGPGIPFTSTPPSRRTPGGHWIPNAIKDYLFGAEYEKCENRDEDPLSHCQPVNCVLKYHGTRNYFSHELKRCVPTQKCVDQLDDKRPVLFLDDHNECQKLSMHLEEEDMSLFSSSATQRMFEPINWRERIRYDCNHGKERFDRGGCECDDGWTTSEDPENRVSHEGWRINQCNVWTPKGHWLMNVYIVLIAVGTLCGILSLLLLALYLYERRYIQHGAGLDDTIMEVKPVKKSSFFERLHNDAEPSTSWGGSAGVSGLSAETMIKKHKMIMCMVKYKKIGHSPEVRSEGRENIPELTKKNLNLPVKEVGNMVYINLSRGHDS